MFSYPNITGDTAALCPKWQISITNKTQCSWPLSSLSTQ
ncbi:hypothetical protein VCHC41B1_0036 [Vibrio cholerae HC-41B1]|nr:DNA binding domain, excisionase family [Vibrio cholerae HC-43B1]EKL05180.1 hypothetical protein VCHC41B1_0036 [Vibrio cholerae HC-41B1]EKM07666.1 DNA binding domain protein, excisionase family [Vibrio cholerae HC-44C1]CFW03096.1 hypothetical protein [Vibrio cholerae]CPR26509.1 hypothetical protein [Vibrio cholerae]